MYNNLCACYFEIQIRVQKISQEERKAREGSKDENESLEADLMDSLLGFSRLFKLLVELQKPIVGHNFLMDLMIMYSQFHEQLPSKFSLYYHCYDLHYKTLPYSNNNNLCISAQLSDFKEKIHRMFPVIYDTKYLSFEIKKIMKREGKILCNILC